MKLVFVTAHLPHGTDEAFLIPEVERLKQLGHSVLVVPRSLRGEVLHGQSLLEDANCEPLFSPSVLAAAMRFAVTSPRQVVGALRRFARNTTAGMFLKNIAVLPKALWLADVARRWNADHIHCHWAGTTATMAMLASHISGIPWSMTAHRWDIVENNLLAHKVESARFARFICADGLKMATERGVHSPNVKVLPMGVRVPAVAPPARRGVPVVLCPARLTPVKGHRVLLEAWKAVKSANVEGDLWIAGGGELRSELETFAVSLGLVDSVQFLGLLPHDRLIRLYESSAISAVVMASLSLPDDLHEGVPVALIEAMSYGIPVLATQTGGIPELIVPGSGVLVPQSNPKALAAELQRLLSDEDLRNDYGRAARQRVLKAYDVSLVIDELVVAMHAAA